MYVIITPDLPATGLSFRIRKRAMSLGYSAHANCKIALVHLTFGPGPLRNLSQETESSLVFHDSSGCSLESVMDHMYHEKFRLVERRHFMGDPSIHGKYQVVFYAQGIPRRRSVQVKSELFQGALYHVMRALVGEPWTSCIATEPFLQHGKPTNRTILRIHLMLPPPITAPFTPAFRQAEKRG
jgi:hypothetical protein